jgi:hypothetical protein
MLEHAVSDTARIDAIVRHSILLLHDNAIAQEAEFRNLQKRSTLDRSIFMSPPSGHVLAHSRKSAMRGGRLPGACNWNRFCSFRSHPETGRGNEKIFYACAFRAAASSQLSSSRK